MGTDINSIKILHTHLHVEFAVDGFSLVIDELECVASISVHVTEPIWSTSVAKQEGDLVGGFRTEGDEIPECIWVLQVCLGITLLGVNETGKLWEKLNGPCQIL